MDYPDEVKALVLMTVACGPGSGRAGTLEFRLKAAEDPETVSAMAGHHAPSTCCLWSRSFANILSSAIARWDRLSQHGDFVVIDQFDVRDRINTLKPPLLLIKGADDPALSPEYELEIHRGRARLAVPET